MSRNYSEDSLVEQPAIELFRELGWEVANCYHETFGANGTLARETAAEVVLISRLKPSLEKLNPNLPPEAIDAAIEALRRDRSAMSLAEANRQIYKLVKNGVRVDITEVIKQATPDHLAGDAGQHFAITEAVVRVKVIDWEHPENNDPS